MSGEVFVDTNVLVYARDSSEAAKHPRAVAWMEFLWRSRRGRLSTQILQEYYVTVTRKLKPGLSREQGRADVESLFSWGPIMVDEQVLSRAFAIEARWGLSWWDALVVAAADHCGCRWLLSEDLQHGQVFGDLTVVNPFRTEQGDLP